MCRPDPTGVTLNAVRRFLKSEGAKVAQLALFWDHACLPQNWIDTERTPEEWQTFDTALACMVKFYASLTATCIIQQRHAPERPAAYDGRISIPASTRRAALRAT